MTATLFGLAYLAVVVYALTMAYRAERREIKRAERQVRRWNRQAEAKEAAEDMEELQRDIKRANRRRERETPGKTNPQKVSYTEEELGLD